MRSEEDWSKLERWQGPPHMDIWKYNEFVLLLFVYCMYIICNLTHNQNNNNHYLYQILQLGHNKQKSGSVHLEFHSLVLIWNWRWATYWELADSSWKATAHCFFPFPLKNIMRTRNRENRIEQRCPTFLHVFLSRRLLLFLLFVFGCDL